MSGSYFYRVNDYAAADRVVEKQGLLADYETDDQNTLQPRSKTASSLVLVIFDCIVAVFVGVALYWFVREAVFFEDLHKQLALFGTVIYSFTGAAVLLSLVGLAVYAADSATSFVLLVSHWMTVVSVPATTVFGLALWKFWPEQAHQDKAVEPKDDFNRFWLQIIVGGTVICLVVAVFGSLRINWNDDRRESVFKWTIFITYLLLFQLGFVVVTLSGMTMRQIPDIIFSVHGWSVYGAIVSGTFVGVLALLGMARPKTDLRLMIILVPIASALLLVCAGFNFQLSAQVSTLYPASATPEVLGTVFAGEDRNFLLLLSAVLGFSAQVFTLLVVFAIWAYSPFSKERVCAPECCNG